MKKILTLAITTLAISAQAHMSSALAKLLACAEADKVHFSFEESCDQALFQDQKPTRTEYSFFGQDDSGDCGIIIKVQRQSGATISKVTCN